MHHHIGVLRSRSLPVLMLAGLLSLSLPLVIAANAQVVYTRVITVPDDFPTMQEAIDNASDGDTISVRAGTYYESIVVDKTVSLVGEDADTTIIDGGGAGHVVIITGDGVNMTGFTVQNSGTVDHITGINLNNVNHCNISGNIVTNNEHGIMLHNYSYYNTVSGNIITENSEWGLHIIDSHYNNVSRNIVGGNFWGSIDIHGYSTHNRVFENDIRKNVGSNETYGFIIDGSEYNIIDGNNIADNLWGISIQYSSGRNSVLRNNIVNNQIGIGLKINTYANVFYYNRLVNNTSQVSLVGNNRASSWDDGYPSGGNYWSDYVGQDLFSGSYQNMTGGDGLGDTPYVIDARNKDNYPLMLLSIYNVTQTPADGMISPADEVRISATIAHVYSMERATLNYTIANGSGTFHFSLEMICVEGDIWSATIPAFPSGTNVSYIIIGQDSEGNTVNSQQQGYALEYRVVPDFPSIFLSPLLAVMVLSVATIAKRRSAW